MQTKNGDNTMNLKLIKKNGSISINGIEVKHIPSAEEIVKEIKRKNE